MYGNSLQDDSKNLNITLTSDPEKVGEMAKENNFVGRQIIDENLVAICTRPRKIKMNRAFPIGT